tara:strand:+ start:8201 stop:8851 length:651 start_codon:yes stop_codon:yes gene_type:complete
MKHIKLFEAFVSSQKLNEKVNIELGNIDAENKSDEPKMEQVNDILKKAVGKSMTGLDLIKIAGHQGGHFGDDYIDTKKTSNKILKDCKVVILDVSLGTYYAGYEHQVIYKYDTAIRNGEKYDTNGKPDLTGEVAKYSANSAKDENGKPSGVGIKFKDFPQYYPDFKSISTADPFGAEEGWMQGSFQIYYPKANSVKPHITMQEFADVFKLSDIIPN